MREADVGSPSADTGRAISDHRISCPASYGDAAPNHQWEISEAVIGAADGTGISPEKDAAPIPMTIFQCEQMFSELPLKDGVIGRPSLLKIFGCCASGRW